MINKIDKLSGTQLLGNVYGLSRSLLAFGSLSTLVFNDIDDLFPLLIKNSKQNFSYQYGYLQNLSIFSLLSDNLSAAKLISILVLFVVLIGWRPRFTGLLHWWISASIFLSLHVKDGGDQITSNLCLLLIPFTLADSRKSHWVLDKAKRQSEYLSIILYSFLLVAKLQISILYFQAAVSKLDILEWKKGTVVYYWFTHNIFGLNDFFKPLFIPLVQNVYTVFLITWGVLILEFVLFAAIFAKSYYKKYFFIAGFLFHFMIFIIHGLFSFFIAMSAALILYLVPIDYDIRDIKIFKRLFLIFRKYK